MRKIIGWIAVFMAVLSLAPSLVPGAMSVIGLASSLGALVVSIFSVSSGRKYHFYTTLSIVGVGVFFVNDALRVWSPLPVSMNAKITMYGISSFVVLACIFSANKLSHQKQIT